MIRGKKIFVVEDEAIIALYLIEEFKKLGAELCQNASSPENAVKMFQMTKFDLVVIDVHLNDSKNGFYVAEEIRKTSQIPIIFTSGYNESEIVESISNFGPSSFIKKPIEIAELLRSLERITDENF